MSEREEALLERAYVLHHRAFRNSSLILDLLTPRYGRVGLVSQGARRARGGSRALLQPFTELRISWVRRGDLGRLTHVEAGDCTPPLNGDGLLAGFYLNELLIRLIARGDPHAELFEAYRQSLAALAGGARIARTVRLFELELLDALGYRVTLDRDCRTAEEIQPDQLYVFEIESGPTRARTDQAELAYPGAHLISLREGRLDDAASLRTARRLLGRVLDTYVGDRPLRSRDVMHQVVGTRKHRHPEATD